jgi:hypothetical protein
VASGCNLIPDIAHQPRYHNPFPQLHRVAILPFFNLSQSPYVDGDKVALLYYEELQAIPGFEVLPLGVVKEKLAARGVVIDEQTNFQKLAAELDVDVVLIGAVTDYTPYYPPRLGLAVRWYAANPAFHPIPPGYGLPWGTAEEEYIPDWIVWEAEFALAREQLATQTPKVDADQKSEPARLPGHDDIQAEKGLPENWPDPSGFIPPPPSRRPPAPLVQSEPIIRHTRIYHGNDEEFTRQLADYYFFRDDARFGGWQAYLQRSEDFIRFCCHLHIAETLAMRGGVGEPKVVWRWPISRYDR